MAVVDINIIKEWFKNLKKPTQEQFWTWLDSFRHKWEKVPLDDVEGLTSVLQKKADLVNGVVPEDQLPFTINTSEVIDIGAITTTANNTSIAVHASGSNKVRINGKILTRAYPNNFPFTPVTIDQKFLRIVAKDEPGLFFLKEGVESDEPQEPGLDAGELHVRLILVTPDGAFIDQDMINGFQTKAEDTWKTVFPNKMGGYSLPYTDERACFSLEEIIPSTTTKYLRNFAFAAETTRDVQFTIKNNTLGNIIITALASEDLVKGFLENVPFTIPSLGTVFAKYNHVRNVVEILKVGTSDSITSIVHDDTFQGNGTTASPAGLSAAKNAEIAGKTTMTAVSTYVLGLGYATTVVVADKLDKVTPSAQNVASAVTFGGNITVPKLILVTQSTNTTVGALHSDGTYVYYNGSGGTPKQIAYDLTGVNVAVIHLTATTINITTTTDANGYKMNGKSVVHDNTADATITVPATTEFICEGVKANTGNLTFAASGITIIQEDATLIVNGAIGSSYRLRKIDSTKYALSIRNL